MTLSMKGNYRTQRHQNRGIATNCYDEVKNE